MDPDSPNQKSRSTPEWAHYQAQNFWKLNDGEVPIFNTRECCLFLSVFGVFLSCLLVLALCVRCGVRNMFRCFHQSALGLSLGV